MVLVMNTKKALYDKAWREKNRDYFRRKNKEFYANNKEYIQLKNALYRMRRGCEIGPVIMEKLLNVNLREYESD